MASVDRKFLMQIFQSVDRDGNGQISATELQGALSNGSWVPFNAETVRILISKFLYLLSGGFALGYGVLIIRYPLLGIRNINAVTLMAAFDHCELNTDMFDNNGDGTVNFEEFYALWKYITDWTSTFRNFDRDNSGSIDKNELANAMIAFGRLLDGFGIPDLGLFMLVLPRSGGGNFKRGYRFSPQFYEVLLRKFDRSATGNVKFDDFIHLCVVLQVLTASFRERDTDLDGWVTVSYEEFLTMVFQLNL
ncbi:Programmed cell death protein 6 [Trichuris trichiura]|uniref:Programmed cell death protein 6 n=1 Tax=Trichuris trichiura TaxID=36087 RepID=A0A077ZB65_TRITR|nr:Programmed cell death protein 6 [Trichuris trichiura]